MGYYNKADHDSWTAKKKKNSNQPPQVNKKGEFMPDFSDFSLKH